MIWIGFGDIDTDLTIETGLAGQMKTDFIWGRLEIFFIFIGKMVLNIN